MNGPVVYLAGPISGLDYAAAQDWRAGVKERLAAFGIRAFSPLRGKSYLGSIGGISATGEEYAHLGPLSTAKGVMHRDRFDAMRCDLLFVNLSGARRVSIGTVMEIAWADAKRTPIVCIMERDNPHQHMMVREACGFIVETVEEAEAVAVSVLTP